LKSKLTQAQKDEIQRRAADGEIRTVIAKTMGIAVHLVYDRAPKVPPRVTREQKMEIVRRVESGETKNALAKEFGLSKVTVQDYTKHVIRKLPEVPQEVRKEIIRRAIEGESAKTIARELGYSVGTVDYHIKNVASDYQLSDEQTAAIWHARQTGKKYGQIAEQLKLPRRVIYAALGIYRKKSTDDALRAQAIRAMETGESSTSVATRLGVSSTAVLSWFRRDVAEGKAKRPENVSKSDDDQFMWIAKRDSSLEHWRKLIVEYAATHSPPFSTFINALSVFVDRYLLAHRLPLNPADLLNRKQLVPDFYAACPQGKSGRTYNTQIYNLIEWVLDSEQFADMEDGEPLRFTDLYRNPIDPNAGGEDALPQARESTKTLLSYLLVSLLRKQIVQGPNFRDWTWAQGLMGNKDLDGNSLGPDWFEVSEDRLDKSDLDCVWRVRSPSTVDRPVLEMWSPVRWVHALLHLQTPVRGGQARMADSGEADTFIWHDAKFIPNPSKLCQGSARNPRQQGVFRRPSTEEESAGAKITLYFNSNKTADIGKGGSALGFECPWPQMEESDEDPYRWLAKLRDWQMKYNPIQRLTRWIDLEGATKLSPQSKNRLQDYPDTAFLFRLPEDAKHPDWPLSSNRANVAWQILLTAFESALGEQGIRSPTGERIELINPETGRAWSSPHATRPSLITHLIMDGNVPPIIMTKVVGHARFIMTLYYTKAGLVGIQNSIKQATKVLEETKHKTFERDLLSANAERMREIAVFNTEDWTTVLPLNSADRSPLGWYYMHDRVCFAGGNTHGNNQVPGCHNGGPVRTKEGRNQKDIHDPVPGGVRNCCRCRWSASGKEHLDSLAATLTNRSWHLQNASNEALATLRERDAILKSKARTEAANEPFGQTHDLTSAERRHEAAMHRMQELTLDVAALNRTIDRVMALPVNVDGPTVLALQGDALTAHAVIEDASELLQLANVVGDMELYPDLQSNTGEAVYAYADLLDNAFECEGHPRILVRLSKDEKMQCANALMRQLERHANPQNHLLGRRAVVEIIDRGESLQKLLGVKLNEIARQALPAKNQTPLRLVKPTTEDDHDDRRAS
jgi:DNA-binding NarL/FixJ family response regulator